MKISEVRLKEIIQFIKKNNIPSEERILNKQEYLKYISAFLFKKYRTNSTIKESYLTELDYIGDIITKDDFIKDYLSYFDFIAKQDLIDAFAEETPSITCGSKSKFSLTFSTRSSFVIDLSASFSNKSFSMRKSHYQ